MERQDKSPEEAEYYRQLNSNVQNFGMYAYQQLQMQYQGAGMYGGYNPMGTPNMMGMPQVMNMGYNPNMYMGGGGGGPYKQYNQHNYNPHYQGGKGNYRTNGGGYNKVKGIFYSENNEKKREEKKEDKIKITVIISNNRTTIESLMVTDRMWTLPTKIIRTKANDCFFPLIE